MQYTHLFNLAILNQPDFAKSYVFLYLKYMEKQVRDILLFIYFNFKEIFKLKKCIYLSLPSNKWIFLINYLCWSKSLFTFFLVGITALLRTSLISSLTVVSHTSNYKKFPREVPQLFEYVTL